MVLVVVKRLEDCRKPPVMSRQEDLELGSIVAGVSVAGSSAASQHDKDEVMRLPERILLFLFSQRVLYPIHLGERRQLRKRSGHGCQRILRE